MFYGPKCGPRWWMFVWVSEEGGFCYCWVKSSSKVMTSHWLVVFADFLCLDWFSACWICLFLGKGYWSLYERGFICFSLNFAAHTIQCSGNCTWCRWSNMGRAFAREVTLSAVLLHLSSFFIFPSVHLHITCLYINLLSEGRLELRWT